MFLDYRNQLDMRIARDFRFGRNRIQGFADIFNVFNAGTVLQGQRNLRIEPGDQRVADSADDHGRALSAIRHANELLDGSSRRRSDRPLDSPQRWRCH